MTQIPKTMRAFVLTGHGDMDKLIFHDDWPTPTPNQNEVLIKVHACGLNNTDVNTRTAWYSKAVTDATTGQSLKADDKDASYPVESELTHEELATFATSWMTAEGMLNRANVKKSDRVLITGASGGVGSALISLANRRGAMTYAVTSEPKREHVKALNPSYIIGRDLKELGNDKVDVVADIVAGDTFLALIQSLERGGRYVTSGAIAGPIVDLDVRTLYLHDLTLLGSTVVKAGTFADIIKYIERRDIKPALAATYPLKELHAAQQAFIDKKHVGNIVVTMED